MSLFAFLGGRHDKKAWGRALFASGCKLPEKPDVNADTVTGTSCVFLNLKLGPPVDMVASRPMPTYPSGQECCVVCVLCI